MTQPANYVAWGTSPLGGLATLLPIENVSDAYELSEGISRADGFPPDAAYRMNPSFPRDVVVPDAVQSRGGGGIPIVSPRLRELIESFYPPDIEYLSITIYDHKGRVASDEHAIANSYHVVDCLDHDAMGIVWNPLDPMAIMTCERVALDPDALDGTPALFRAKNLEKRVLVRRDLADAIGEAGMSGVYFYELDDVRA
jgi:hypothetical protein